MPVLTSPFDLMLRKLEMHTPLDAGDRAALRNLPHTVRTFDAASYLVREGDPPKNCAVMLSGYAFRQKLTGHGARQIVAIHIPGDIIDLQNIYLDVSDHAVQTLTRAELALVPREAIRDLIRTHPGIGHAAIVNLLVEGAISREWIVNIGRRDARARLAHLLCEFALRLDAQGLSGPDGYELPMSQEQLADTLGLTPVHVNRTLRALEKEGLVERRGRRVRFPEWAALRQVADFNSLYLHLSQQKS